jgi:hypothetical protein
MKDLIDFKKVWDWCVVRWRTSFGCVVLALVTFWLGMALQEKLITEDCRFMGSFRDGAQAYNCQPRVR